MAQATQKKERSGLVTAHIGRGVREGALFILLAIAAYLFIALVSFDPSDPGWSQSGGNGEIANSGGVAGAWFADVFLYLFGYLAYLLPIMVAYSAWLVYSGSKDQIASFDINELWLRAGGFFLALTAGAALASMRFGMALGRLPHDAGGILGDAVSSKLIGLFNLTGSTLFLLALFLAGVTLFTRLSWVGLIDFTGQWALRGYVVAKDYFFRGIEYWRQMSARRQRDEVIREETQRTKKREPVRIEPVIAMPESSSRPEKERQVPLFEPTVNSDLPPLSLLDPAEKSKHSVSAESLTAMSRQVELKLRDFGVDVEVVSVLPGPVVTRYEMQPAAGVKVSKIVNLSKDLARSLSVTSVRIVEVIPGKPVIGLEIPNEHREVVRLSEILRSKQYDDAKSPLTLALGKDISGQPAIADLARMPHLLVAGTTGSGKSVGVNAMVLSLLYNATPADVRMIMIDPKMLELSVYDDIPHLLAPVVTDMKEAANSLRWCVAEMELRYARMAALGVRNLAGYNRKIKDAEDEGKPIPDPLITQVPEGEEMPMLHHLPHIVVVIDEFADMIMVVGKKVEELIARLAQKARAAGIHLIVATQRPSVDVITGLIKANIPTRIAFQVSSKIDSRTILDQVGAEQLLGQGDMLYLPPGTAIPVRIHGAFVADHEVHKVVKQIKSNGAPNYVEALMASSSGITLGSQFDDMEMDELYDEAVAIVTETRRASISGLQRRLKVGYNRAARLVETMETTGVVGPMQSNGSREVIAPPPPK